jgi:hypothetical protein
MASVTRITDLRFTKPSCGSIKLHPDFKVNAAVPIDGDVATGPRLLRTHCIPDQPTALGHDARKLGRAGLASDHSEGHTIELVELDCRGHQWTLPYNLGLGDAEDRLYEIKPATAFVMVTLCLYQPPRST